MRRPRYGASGEFGEGAEGLSAPDALERDTLAICGSSPTMRLTCQLRVTGDVPRIVLRVVDPL